MNFWTIIGDLKTCEVGECIEMLDILNSWDVENKCMCVVYEHLIIFVSSAYHSVYGKNKKVHYRLLKQESSLQIVKTRKFTTDC